MIIPKLHYISQGNSGKEHLDNIQKACTSGAELVQLNLKNVSEKNYLKLAKAAREITSHFQTRLILTDHYKIAKEVKADGVHLNPLDHSPTEVRKHLNTWQSIGATANTLQDCETLISKEIDYISLGPFRSTKTNDNMPSVLGLNGYKAIIDAINAETIIIAFGEITTEDVPELLETGVSGVAVSDEITRDFNSIRTFNQLLVASSTAEQRHTFK